MRLILMMTALLLAACGDDTDAADLPRDSQPVPDYTAPAEWPRTGKERMPLDNIVADLEPLWTEVSSCEQVGYTREMNGDTWTFHLLHAYSRSERRSFDLACEMERHGHYVSHIARVQKPVWSDYDQREVPTVFTFFRIRAAEGPADFAIFHGARVQNGNARVSSCDREARTCIFAYDTPFDVIDMTSGLYTRFKLVSREVPLQNNPGLTTRERFPEESGPIAFLTGRGHAEMQAFVSGDSDAIPRALAFAALVREVHRQYPDGSNGAFNLPGRIRTTQSGVVVEDIGAQFGMRETDASYVVRLDGVPDCAETRNERVRQCTLKVSTSIRAYDRRTGSTQTKIAQIANVAEAGRQSGEIEALFVREDSGWRMVVTEEIARFLSGVDRRSTWFVRTGDGRTLSGGAAVQCIANPDNC